MKVVIARNIAPPIPVRFIIENPTNTSPTKFNLGGADILAAKAKNHIKASRGLAVVIPFCIIIFRDLVEL